MGSSSGPRLMNCENCGRVIEEDSRFCQYCGFDKSGEDAKVVEEKRVAKQEQSLLPLAAGILIIIASFLLLYTVWISRSESVHEGSVSWYLSVVYAWPLWFQILMVISAVMGFVGGLSALFRRSQVVAFIGAALSALGFGAPLGLIGLLLVAVSEHQFDSELADFTKPLETIETRRIDGLEYERRI